jgi:hypothetical protein
MAVATTFGHGRTILTVASLDSDWTYSTDFPHHSNGIRALSVQYLPSGNADVFILKEGSATGPDICYCSSLNNFETKYFFGRKIKPMYDVSDRNSCAASANAKIIFTLGGDSN